MLKWKKEQLYTALKEIEDGKVKVSICSAAKKYGIPPTTLHDHVKHTVSKSGARKPTILTLYTEEEAMVIGEGNTDWNDSEEEMSDSEDLANLLIEAQEDGRSSSGSSRHTF